MASEKQPDFDILQLNASAHDEKLVHARIFGSTATKSKASKAANPVHVHKGDDYGLWRRFCARCSKLVSHLVLIQRSNTEKAAVLPDKIKCNERSNTH